MDRRKDELKGILSELLAAGLYLAVLLAATVIL